MVKDIVGRLKMALSVKTDTELATVLNISQQAISSWKTRDSIDIMFIMKYLPPGTDLNWLLRGDPVGEPHVIPEEKQEDKIDKIEKDIKEMKKLLTGMLTKHGRRMQGLSSDDDSLHHSKKLSVLENAQ